VSPSANDDAPAATITGQPDRRETTLALRTVDGVDLHAVLFGHSAADPERDPDIGGPGAGAIGLVLAPGFSGCAQRPDVLRVARALARHAAVLCVDLRGHGRSGGRSTLGNLEVLDVDAAVAELRRRGYEQVVTCGFSMGGASVIRHAALSGAHPPPALVGGAPPVSFPPDAVVSVSSTSRWFVRDTPAMRRLHLMVTTRLGRRIARRYFGVRIDPKGWQPLPESPVEIVARVAPTPLLVVHGDRDHYFTIDHPRALAAAAGQPTEVWEVHGFAHAETGADAPLLDRIGGHLRALLAAVPEECA
jgi:pimeloyl-ACP methyl ester carboxylesterase